MQQLENSELKALFAQLVEAIGTHEAAATFLKVSRQRVGQLASLRADHRREVPTWQQVFALEAELGQSIVFRALALRVEGEAPADVMGASVAAISATSAALQATADMMADGIPEAHELERALKAARASHEATEDHLQSLERLAAINAPALGAA